LNIFEKENKFHTYVAFVNASQIILFFVFFLELAALRRRRQNAEKYVTDPAQLNLRFTRPSHRSSMG
jgi:hypothetical protein